MELEVDYLFTQLEMLQSHVVAECSRSIEPLRKDNAWYVSEGTKRSKRISRYHVIIETALNLLQWPSSGRVDHYMKQIYESATSFAKWTLKFSGDVAAKISQFCKAPLVHISIAWTKISSTVMVPWIRIRDSMIAFVKSRYKIVWTIIFKSHEDIGKDLGLSKAESISRCIDKKSKMIRNLALKLSAVEDQSGKFVAALNGADQALKQYLSSKTKDISDDMTFILAPIEGAIELLKDFDQDGKTLGAYFDEYATILRIILTTPNMFDFEKSMIIFNTLGNDLACVAQAFGMALEKNSRNLMLTTTKNFTSRIEKSLRSSQELVFVFLALQLALCIAILF